jgi:hypothetical protein
MDTKPVLASLINTFCVLCAPPFLIKTEFLDLLKRKNERKTKQISRLGRDDHLMFVKISRESDRYMLQELF